MNKIYAKIAATAVTVVVMGGMFASSVLAVDEVPSSGLVIAGNGAGSENSITIKNTSNCVVSQSNITSVNVGVSVSASTGGNKANGNTGGDVTVTSGDATATSAITVTGGDNSATNPCCACSVAPSTADAAIVGNGAKSENKVKTTTTQNSTLVQGGSTTLNAFVKVNAKTGKNKAKNNTGGSVSVGAGSSTSGSTINVTGGSNSI